MKIKQIKETCLYIRSIERIRSFYQDVLELPVINQVKGRHIFFRAGTSVLLCFVAEESKNQENLPPHFAFGNQHLAFEVTLDDYSKWKERLEKNGIEITHVQQWKDGLNSIYFEDPEKNVLEIVPEGIWE